MPDLELARFLGDAFDDFFEDRLMGEQARAGGAALALVVKDRARCAGDGQFEIRIGEDDGRRFAAQFQRDPLQVAGRCLDDQLADLGRAGEGDLVDIGVFSEGGPGRLPKPGDDVHYASGKPASVTSSPSRMAESGVCSAGLSTMVHPAANAGASFHAAIIRGKFQGIIWPTTPTGSRMV